MPSPVRVVVVLPGPPYLEGSAAGRCAAALLKGLDADERVELSTIAARLPRSPEGIAPGVPVEIVSVPVQDRLQAWSELVRRPVAYLSQGEFGERVRGLAAKADVLHLDQVETARCDVGSGVPSLLHLHYLTYLDQPQLPRSLRRAVVRFGYGAAERHAAQRHRFLLANSSVVASELRRRAPRAEVTVVPLVLDPDHYLPSLNSREPVAGFIGTATWPMTAAATRRLVKRVWPLVRRELPTARLLVAGRGSDALGLTPGPGVDVVGEVESGAEFFRDVSLLLFPAEAGSGTKVKTLEALASGVPVVTTAVGAEGIAGNDGVVVADDDEALARAAVSVLRDDEERKQRGAAGLQAFREGHTPAIAAGMLVELYSRMASSI